MRVAALCDVHGNLPALEAVLAETEEAGVDAIVLGGDISAGPQPAETLERLRAYDAVPVHWVRGNADRELATPDALEESIAERLRWVAAQMSDEQLRSLTTLPESITLDVEGLGPVLFCHATPTSDMPIFTAATPDERVARLLGDIDERVVVCGHTHMQFDRAVGGVRVVNPGSVGMSYDAGPGARWAVLGPDVEFRTTAYDVRAAVRAVREAKPPDEDQHAELLEKPPPPDEVVEFFEQAAAKQEVGLTGPYEANV